jgi:hypothetical protein
MLALALATTPVGVHAQQSGAARDQWTRPWSAWNDEWRQLDAYGSRIPPAERVERQKRALAELEKLAPQAPTPFDRQLAEHYLANGYFLAGTLARYRLMQPREAESLLANAARYGSLYGAVGLADVRRFELGNPVAAADALGMVVPAMKKSEAVQRQEPKIAAWIERWIGHERRYLQSGRRFAGALVEADVEAAPFILLPGLGGDSITGSLATMPPGALTLLTQAHQLATVTDYAELVRLLDRHDPAGFLSAAFFGRLVSIAGLIGPEEAKAAAQGLGPGPRPSFLPVAAGGPAPAIALAERYFSSRDVRYAIRPEDPQMQTPEGTWRLFLASLRAGDRAAALACFAPRMSETMGPLLEKMSARELREMADSFTGFSLMERTDPFQEFGVTRNVKGVGRASVGSFLRTGKSWKIESI